jgi:hypothetical protein
MELGPMTSTPHHSPITAAGHFVEAERLLTAVPLAKKGDQDRQVALALVHAVLSIAVGFTTNPEGLQP